jgi:hypothetical protein
MSQINTQERKIQELVNDLKIETTEKDKLTLELKDTNNKKDKILIDL